MYRTDLANLVGTARENLIRQLGEMKEEGIISTAELFRLFLLDTKDSGITGVPRFPFFLRWYYPDQVMGV
jgi:hypothetical protein